jgi:hypothetical protein
VTDDFRVTQRQLGLTVVTAPTVVAAAARLPAAVVGSSFEARLRVVGGLAPYSWELSAARRPPGLTLSGGVLAGRPLVAGRYVFDVVVRDGAGSRASHRVALTVLPRVKIPAQALAPGAVGAPYRGTIRARGGAVPLAYTVVEGSLPPGITLDRRTGALVGAPARPGRYSFAIGVGDRSGGMHRRTFVLRIR